LDPQIFLDPNYEEIYSTPFWYTFIREAERRLSALNVKSRNVAIGDLKLPHCEYASLRNEAFVKVGNECIYPPNSAGFNAAEHFNPFLDLIFFLKELKQS
jgi:hypothetical protein